jgi:hypothetical protein
MKKSLHQYTGIFLIMALLGVTSCTKDFGERNSNPSVVVIPDIKYLLSYSEDKIITYQGGEWVWESMDQLLRFTQHFTASPFAITNNVNARYTNFYSTILPNLFEIRRQIEAKADKEKYQKMKAITYILQVMHGIKVTDMNGAIPYTQAIGGRYENNYSPVYDLQQSLMDTYLEQLDEAISTLSAAAVPLEQDYGPADIYYNNNWNKWIGLANTLKLRIAARLEIADNAKCRQIFQQVMQNPVGAISSDAGQVVYMNPDYAPFGTSGDIDYQARRYGTISIINFLKASKDPRLPIYFDKNDLVGSYKDTLTKYATTLPAFINPADPLLMYQGAPADPGTNPPLTAFITNPFQVGNTNASNNRVTNYFLISSINRKFFSPKMNATTGNFTAVEVTYAETCFYIAEFIQKGYAGGVDTKGSAADWYKKGVTSSILTMNVIAKNATSTPANFATDGSAEIAAYLAAPQVAFNGTNDLERIYVQQYLNFYRLANEAFVFCRRTGYPKLGSTYYAREAFTEVIPRRFWLVDPGEVNRANWTKALQEQGFTLNAQDVPTLSKERIWYDKNAPDFGKGN